MSALVLIDLQNDFLDAPGLEPSKNTLIGRVAMLLAAWRRAGRPVVHVFTTIRTDAQRMPHWRRANIRRVVEGTAGHAPPPSLRPLPGELILHKTAYSPFVDGDSADRLRMLGVESMTLAGVHLHGCVRATALDLYQRGWKVVIVEDAVGDYDPLHGEVTRQHLDARVARFRSAAALGDEFARETVTVSRALPAAVIGGLEIGRDGTDGYVHRSPRARSELLWRMTDAGEDQIARAVGAAAEAHRSWCNTPMEHRFAVMQRLTAGLHGAREELARLMAVEIGKPVRDALAEVDFAIGLIDSAVRWASRAGEVNGAGWHVARPPRGVIAVITPFNNPLAVPIGKLAPALLYGNGVVWKPAPSGSAVALRALALLHESGCPPGLVNLTLGHNATSRAVMASEGVDAVTLTGSTLAGYAAQAIAARRRVPLQAELGGNNAAVVMPGADLSAAAQAVVLGAFGSAGQRCTANRRAIVHAECEVEFEHLLKAFTENLVWGDPLDPDTQVGPLISDAALARVSRSVDLARASGADVWRPPPVESFELHAEGGSYYPPTMVRAPADAPIAREETFGPVLVLQTARDLDEALFICNDVRQGLVASIFTSSQEDAERFVAGVRCGIVKINQSTAGVHADAPFGGAKQSSVGPPEHGPADRDFYTRSVTVYDGAT